MRFLFGLSLLYILTYSSVFLYDKAALKMPPKKSENPVSGFMWVGVHAVNFLEVFSCTLLLMLYKSASRIQEFVVHICS